MIRDEQCPLEMPSGRFLFRKNPLRKLFHKKLPHKKLPHKKLQ
jgi:hypothetical protein